MSEADKIIESLKNSGRKVEEFYTGNKGNDINVDSIDEDINELKTLLFQDRLTNYGKRKMINYYENEITRQKQINEEHQKINGELREKVKELEKESKILEFQNKQIENYAEELKKYNKTVSDRMVEYKKNSIPKQVVKEFKESITLDNTIVGGRRNGKTLEYGIKLGKIKACEELLGEDK